MKGHFTPHTKETKRKISQSRKGKCVGEQHHAWKEKIKKRCLSCGIEFLVRPSRKNKKYCSCECLGKSMIGHIPWNKGIKGVMPEPWNKGKKLSKEIRKKLSKAHKGQKSWNKGKKLHYPIWNKGLRGYMAGKSSPHWKGGITPINQKIRGSLEYKLWQDSVKNRDCNCCQKCGENRVSKLMAHHIQNFSQFPELRLAINNGITFCRECHKKFHKKYKYRNNTLEQIKTFIL